MERVFSFLLLQAEQPAIRYFTLKDPNPEHSLAWYVVNAFYFVGVALIVMVSLGILFGGFRYWLLTKFPHNKLNGTDEDDLLHSFRLND